jgi:hypothetical protein
LPALPAKGTTTVTTGLITFSYPISISEIYSFATRFGSTFVEYRIVRARFRIRMFSSTNPGVLQLWFDEQSSGTPTLAEAYERYIDVLSASAVDTQPLLRWVCADPLDLEYRPIGTSYTPCTFKMYTNNSTFGSSAVAADYFEVEPEFQVQFRGLQGV